MKKVYISAILMAFTAFSYAQTALVQVIHNSPDSAAQTVDIYLNDTLLINDFQFRRASPFVEIPAGVQIAIGVAPGNSSNVSDTVSSSEFTLDANEKYIIVANGMISSNGFTPMQPFVLSVFDMGREEASQSGNTDVLVMHGSTDAPNVDIVERTAGMLVEDIAYGEFSDDYLELPTADYILDVKPTGVTEAVASFSAPLQTLNLQGQAIVVLASGFLNPANNSNGAGFGLWVALPAGGPLVELQSVPTSVKEHFKNNFLIYPNPVSNNINFTLDADLNNATVEIINLSGQVVKSLEQRNIQHSTNQSIDISSLPSGVYIFSIKTQNEVMVKKITKF
ncbi:MAG: DUF4397 domain-containing protein [Bacteroidetes bacterium]|nr:DUF4397 domain-containing protein [Bacteroidota bacterium]